LYHISISDTAEYFLDKLDRKTELILREAINKLRFNPESKGKYFGKDRFTGKIIFEKRIYSGKAFRIYYTVFKSSSVVVISGMVDLYG